MLFATYMCIRPWNAPRNDQEENDMRTLLIALTLVSLNAFAVDMEDIAVLETECNAGADSACEELDALLDKAGWSKRPKCTTDSDCEKQ